MFYDEPTNNQAMTGQRLLKPFKILMIGVTIAMLAPIAALAFTPVMLMLLPLAFVAVLVLAPAALGGAQLHPARTHSMRGPHPALPRPVFVAEV